MIDNASTTESIRQSQANRLRQQLDKDRVFLLDY